jgi:hypothetical protein
MDEDGYPEIETLIRITEWPWADAEACLDRIFELWHIETGAQKYPANETTVYRFATGGWSGNEDLIAALRGNTMIWLLTWHMSQRGGLHVFHVTPLRD